MIGKNFPEKNGSVLRVVLIFVLMIAMVLLMTACAAPAEEAPPAEEAAAEPEPEPELVEEPEPLPDTEFELLVEENYQLGEVLEHLTKVGHPALAMDSLLYPEQALDYPVIVVTDSDVLNRIVDRGKNPATLPLSEVMTPEEMDALLARQQPALAWRQLVDHRIQRRP